MRAVHINTWRGLGLDQDAARGYQRAMDDAPQPRRAKLGPIHMAVMVVWLVVAGWMLGAMITSVVDAVFFGDGPVKTGQAQGVGAEAPTASTRPTP